MHKTEVLCYKITTDNIVLVSIWSLGAIYLKI